MGRQLASASPVILLPRLEQHMHILGQRREMERLCLHEESLARLATHGRTTQHLFLTASVPMGDSTDDYERHATMAAVAVILSSQG